MNFMSINKNIKKNDVLASFKPNTLLKQTQTTTFQGDKQSGSLEAFHHYIYEYKKNIRPLILTSEKPVNREIIEKKLKRENIPYIIHEMSDKKINVYLGDQACLDIVSTFDKKLSKLTPEQDFILGIMLGYDRRQECQRYLKLKKKEGLNLLG